MTAPARTMSARSKPYTEHTTKTRPCLRCGIEPGPGGFSKGVCQDCRPYGPVIEIRTQPKTEPIRPEPGPDCGTTTGRRKHQRNGQLPCRPCMDAFTEYNRNRRKAKAA